MMLARQSANKSSFDEMIRLLNRSMHADHSPEFADVRRVLYSNREDIIPLLTGQSLLRAEAPEFKPKFTPALETKPSEEIGGAAVNELTGLTADKAQHGLVNVTRVQNFTEDEEHAALRIQQVYRRHRRRNELSGSAHDASRKVYFEQCYKQAQSMQLSHRVYRMMLLGPLAHALLCADKIHQVIFAAKRKTKSQFLDMNHENLEEIRARQTKSTHCPLLRTLNYLTCLASKWVVETRSRLAIAD
jgi:hypothetical protein